MGQRVIKSYIKFEFEEIDQVGRLAWGARPPIASYPMNLPSNIICIYYTNTKPCYTREECATAMKELQVDHMDNKNHIDIKFNFFIGADGSVYEGRGWNAIGMKLPLLNVEILEMEYQHMVDIAFIGSYEEVRNSPVMKKTLRNFINYWQWRGNIAMEPIYIWKEGFPLENENA